MYKDACKIVICFVFTVLMVISFIGCRVSPVATVGAVAEFREGIKMLQSIAKHFIITEQGFGFSWAVGFFVVVFWWLVMSLSKLKITKKER